MGVNRANHKNVTGGVGVNDEEGVVSGRLRLGNLHLQYHHWRQVQ